MRLTLFLDNCSLALTRLECPFPLLLILDIEPFCQPNATEPFIERLSDDTMKSKGAHYQVYEKNVHLCICVLRVIIQDEDFSPGGLRLLGRCWSFHSMCMRSHAWYSALSLMDNLEGECPST